jgi:hypothetical protein
VINTTIILPERFIVRTQYGSKMRVEFPIRMIPEVRQWIEDNPDAITSYNETSWPTIEMNTFDDVLAFALVFGLTKDD